MGRERERARERDREREGERGRNEEERGLTKGEISETDYLRSRHQTPDFAKIIICWSWLRSSSKVIHYTSEVAYYGTEDRFSSAISVQITRLLLVNRLTSTRADALIKSMVSTLAAASVRAAWPGFHGG